MGKLYMLVFLLFALALSQQQVKSRKGTCSSRVISLIPKTMKYHNIVNNTKELLCKSASLPSFAFLDQKCYLIISPDTIGDFTISVNITILQNKKDGTQSSISVSVSYVLTIAKIRYNGLSQQQVEYDISLNRIINIQSQLVTWLARPGQSFFAQFTVNNLPKLYEKVFFEFINLPSGLKGHQFTGIIQGSVQVPPGYYSFAVRVFDLEGNSQTLEATMMVEDPNQEFDQQEYEDEQTLKVRVEQVDRKIAENAGFIAEAKNNIQKKLEMIATARAELSELNTYQRRLEGTEKSLGFALNWTITNLETIKKKLQAAQLAFNDYNSIVNEAKRTFQTSVFTIQEKQSQIEKQQLEADRRFEMYLQEDKNYAKVRLELDECEKKNQRIANQAMSNLKELDRANFVQNLYDIIQNQ